MAIKLPISGHYINGGWQHRIHRYAPWTGIRTDPHIFQLCSQPYRGFAEHMQNMSFGHFWCYFYRKYLGVSKMEIALFCFMGH